jgi:hypothetical protein
MGGTKSKGYDTSMIKEKYLLGEGPYAKVYQI